MLKRRDFKVYRFKTINKTIIYVGYSGKSTIERFSEHVKDKYWINDVTEVEECIIENEAQARLVEMYYINSLKPIFNAKDKFAGAIQSKLRPQDKKFTHSFYVLNGIATSCVAKTNDDHTLVNIVPVNDAHIGMYYDSYLNLYYSASDICNILKIKSKDLINLAKNNTMFIKTSYDYMHKGKDKTSDLYLCTYDAIDSILALSNSELKNQCKNRLSISRRWADINSIYRDPEEALTVKTIYDEQLRFLSGDRYEDSDIKRKLVFKALNCDRGMESIVDSYNKQMNTYDIKFPAEVLACDIFSMVEDLSNEYNLSYKDVFSEFNEFLIKYKNLNFWKINNSTKKKLNDYTLQSHFIIALNKDILYNHFLEFYNKNIESAA